MRCDQNMMNFKFQKYVTVKDTLALMSLKILELNTTYPIIFATSSSSGNPVLNVLIMVSWLSWCSESI